MISDSSEDSVDAAIAVRASCSADFCRVRLSVVATRSQPVYHPLAVSHTPQTARTAHPRKGGRDSTQHTHTPTDPTTHNAAPHASAPPALHLTPNPATAVHHPRCNRRDDQTQLKLQVQVHTPPVHTPTQGARTEAPHQILCPSPGGWHRFGHHEEEVQVPKAQEGVPVPTAHQA